MFVWANIHGSYFAGFIVAAAAALDAVIEAKWVRAVIARWSLEPHEDLTAVTYVPSIDRILVLSDKSDRILVLTANGSIESEVEVPGEQQEGLTVDGKGDVWLADDKDKSLLRLPGGLRALETHVKGTAAPSGQKPPSAAPRAAA